MSTTRTDNVNTITMNELTAFAHELRTPLAAIGGLAQLLEIGIHGPVSSAQADVLERIRLNQAQAVTLIAEFVAQAEQRLRAPTAQPDDVV